VTLAAGDLAAGGTFPSISGANLTALNADNVTSGTLANARTSATSLNTASAIVARDASGNFAAGTITATLSGNASTATALATARAINGVAFDGTAAITITAAAGTLTGTTLAATVVSSSLTSVGTLSSLTVSGTITTPLRVNIGSAAVDTSAKPLNMAHDFGTISGGTTRVGGYVDSMASTTSTFTSAFRGTYSLARIGSTNTGSFTFTPAGVRAYDGIITTVAGSTGSIVSTATYFADTPLASGASIGTHYQFYAAAATAAGTNWAYFSAGSTNSAFGGWVSINKTTTPAVALDVAGAISSTGDVNINSGKFIVTAATGNISATGSATAASYRVGANQILGARDTGWSAMTGTSNKATVYDTSTVTLAQLAGRVMALQAALTSHGAIGA
jgi:hypothetical protein